MKKIYCNKCKLELQYPDACNKKIENDTIIPYSDVIRDEEIFWKNYKEGDSYGKWAEKWIGSFR